MLAAYTGHEALTFSDYLDLETGKTLHAEPGRTYDIAPASGRLADEVPLQWFTPVDAEDRAAGPDAAEAERLAAETAAAGDGEDPAPDGSGEPAAEGTGADENAEGGQSF